MNITDPLLKKALKDIAKEKDLTQEELKSFLAKIALIEAGPDLDPSVKQKEGGPGRGIAQWETNEGKGSNRVVTSLWRTNNYFKSKGEKIPEFLTNALDSTQKDGTYDMTKLNRDQQLLVLLSDFRMGNGDLADIKEGDQFDIWRNHWWQGNEEEVPIKRQLWNNYNKYFEKNKDKVFNKLYDTNLNNINQNEDISKNTNIPFINKKESLNYNVPENNNDFKNTNLTDYINQNKQQNSKVSQHIDESKALVNDYLNNPKALGGITSAGNKIQPKSLNSFNTGGSHEHNRLGGIPLGTGNNGKTNTVEQNETSFNTSKGKFIFSDRINLTDYINSTLKKNSNNQFAKGGNIENPNPFPFLPNEKPTMGPKRPIKEEKVVDPINKKETTVFSKKKRNVSNLNKLFFDFSKEKEKVGRFRNPLDILEGNNPNKYSELDERFSEIHKESNKSCLAGAMNCSQEFISENSGLPGLRTIISNSNADSSKYKIPSRDKSSRIMGSDYIPNQSIDAWEIHDFLVGEGLGENLFTKDKNTKYEKDSYLPKGFDYKNIPLGAVIGQGNSSGVYTNPKDGERSRHALTVVGFDNKDGMPMVYDYGKLTRLDSLNALNSKSFKINRITVPNEYKGMTSDRIKKDINNEEKRLGYSDRKPLSFNSDKPHLKAIEEGVNEVATKIGYNYGIPNKTINKFSELLPGLSNQETKINNNEGVSKSAIIDNVYGNNILKPAIKIHQNIWDKASGFFKEKGDKKQDYQLEIEAYKKYPKDEDKFIEYFNALKQENEKLKSSKKSNKINLDSSVGPFAIKDITDYAVKELGIEKSDLYGIRNSNKEELKKGSQVALSYLAENYNKFKEKYPELSEDELVDLTMVSYNNKAKTEDPEFIKYYIKNKKLKDNYLEKIKSYKIK